MTAAPTRPDLLVRRRKDKERRIRQALHGDLIVSAGPVIAHMQRLRAQGWTARQIADAAGIAHSTPHALAHQQTTKRSVADRVLQVRVGPPPTLSSHTQVDSTGARRRLQALATLGWSPERIAGRAGISRGPVYRALQGRGISIASDVAIRAVYDDLWDVRATGGRHEVIAARARAAGWAPPLAWDDDEIDNPGASPQGVADLGKGWRGRINVEDVEEVIAEWPTVTTRQLAERFGVGPTTVHNHLRRKGRRDLLDILNRNAILVTNRGRREPAA